MKNRLSFPLVCALSLLICTPSQAEHQPSAEIVVANSVLERFASRYVPDSDTFAETFRGLITRWNVSGRFERRESAITASGIRIKASPNGTRNCVEVVWRDELTVSGTAAGTTVRADFRGSCAICVRTTLMMSDEFLTFSPAQCDVLDASLSDLRLSSISADDGFATFLAEVQKVTDALTNEKRLEVTSLVETAVSNKVAHAVDNKTRALVESFKSNFPGRLSELDVKPDRENECWTVTVTPKKEADEGKASDEDDKCKENQDALRILVSGSEGAAACDPKRDLSAFDVRLVIADPEDGNASEFEIHVFLNVLRTLERAAAFEKNSKCQSQFVALATQTLSGRSIRGTEELRIGDPEKVKVYYSVKSGKKAWRVSIPLSGGDANKLELAYRIHDDGTGNWGVDSEKLSNGRLGGLLLDYTETGSDVIQVHRKLLDERKRQIDGKELDTLKRQLELTEHLQLFFKNKKLAVKMTGRNRQGDAEEHEISVVLSVEEL